MVGQSEVKVLFQAEESLFSYSSKSRSPDECNSSLKEPILRFRVLNSSFVLKEVHIVSIISNSLTNSSKYKIQIKTSKSSYYKFVRLDGFFTKVILICQPQAMKSMRSNFKFLKLFHLFSCQHVHHENKSSIGI